MHVLILTDGSLDAERAASFAARLAGDEGRVSVFTAVEVPRRLLDEMRSAASADDAASAVDAEYQRSQAGDLPVGHWIGDDAFVERYVNRVVATTTADVVEALTEAGVEVEVHGVEAENASRAVLDAVREQAPDVVCVGTHGVGRFEGLLGSLSTKVARLASCSVLLVR